MPRTPPKPPDVLHWLVSGLLVAGLALPAAAQSPHKAVLTVSDHLGAGQQEETITVYLGGVSAGTLHVDQEHPSDSFTTAVPDAPRMPFTLCGRLVRREPDGSTSEHSIDNGGVLAGYAGSTLDAMTLGDVLFTLRDVGGQVDVTTQRGPACTAAVS